MNRSRCLVAGPWLGEFGWECFCWQAYIRAYSRKFDKSIIISQGNTKELYSDFADAYIKFNKPGVAVMSERRGYRYNVQDVKKILNESDIDLDSHDLNIVLPTHINTAHIHFTKTISCGPMGILKPEYVKLGIRQHETSKCVVFHARNRKHRPADNWKLKHWQHLASQLMEDGYTIISIGTKNESLHVPNTVDKRGAPFADVIDILNKCDYLFGPTSGGTHISFLCETPQVLWSVPGNRLRNEINWNPFSSPVLFLDKYSWHPPAAYVYEEFKRWKGEEL